MFLDYGTLLTTRAFKGRHSIISATTSCSLAFRHLHRTTRTSGNDGNTVLIPPRIPMIYAYESLPRLCCAYNSVNHLYIIYIFLSIF